MAGLSPGKTQLATRWAAEREQRDERFKPAKILDYLFIMDETCQFHCLAGKEENGFGSDQASTELT